MSTAIDASPAAELEQDPGSVPPNVLIIVSDDQRVDTLDVMPATLEHFGGGGTNYSKAFATTPLCCPSRASIMTGRFAHNHRVTKNGEAQYLNQNSTLQRMLSDEGYITAQVGKYLNGWQSDEGPPYFDRWATLIPPDDARVQLDIRSDGYYGAPFNVDGGLEVVDGYSTHFVGDRSIDFLRDFENEDERPWFMYVAPYGPHDPFVPAPEHVRFDVPPWNPSASTSEADLSDKPSWVQADTAEISGERARRRQLRVLMSVDALVDRVMDELTLLGEADNTLAIFVSDNGFMWGEHGLVGKAHPYPETAHIPLFVRWPGRIPAGAVDNRFAATIDLAPTILDAAGVAPDAIQAMDGRSLLQPSTRSIMLLEYWKKHPGHQPPRWASLRTDEYQYVEFYGTKGGIIFREYYDLEADPAQMENLLGDGDTSNDPNVAALSELLHSVSTCSGLSCP